MAKTKTEKVMVMVEKELIILDSSDDDHEDEAANNKGKEKGEEMVSQTHSQSHSNRSESVNKIIAEERKILSDLSSFPNLSAMIAAEISMKKTPRKEMLKKMNEGEGGSDGSGMKQVVPSGSGTLQIQMIVVDEPEKEKIVDNCISESKTVSESFIDNQQSHIECEPHHSLPAAAEEKISGDDTCCKDQMNLVATKVLLVEEKNNEEQDVVQPQRYSSTPSSGLMTCHGCEEGDHIASKGSNLKRKKPCSDYMEMLADLSGFPGLSDMFAAEANMRKKNRRSNQAQNMKKNLSKANENENETETQTQTQTEQEQIINSCTSEAKTVSESQINSDQPPIEERVSRDNHCSIVQTGAVAPNALLKIHDKGKEALVDSCTVLDRVTWVKADSIDREKRNMVLQSLLRPPRYFSPPASELITCDRCGEGDHVKSECTKPKRQKPCSICADRGHQFSQCRKFTACIICNGKGHLAKNCRKNKEIMDVQPKSCLKCGNSGHDMFSCDATYSSDDLKNIKCFICKEFGHLCCFEYSAEGASQVSCYTCGELGHSGSEHIEYSKNQRSLKLASKPEEERCSDVEQLQHVKSEEQGNSETQTRRAEQRDTTFNVRPARRMNFRSYNAQNQTINPTQGWQRNKFVWVREQKTEPNPGNPLPPSNL